ncbi:hypothetical protein D3C81_1229360 [compost metagenome]
MAGGCADLFATGFGALCDGFVQVRRGLESGPRLHPDGGETGQFLLFAGGPLMQGGQRVEGAEQHLRRPVPGVRVRWQLQRCQGFRGRAAIDFGQRLQGVAPQHLRGVFLIRFALDLGPSQQEDQPAR